MFFRLIALSLLFADLAHGTSHNQTRCIDLLSPETLVAGQWVIVKSQIREGKFVPAKIVEVREKAVLVQAFFHSQPLEVPESEVKIPTQQELKFIQSKTEGPEQYAQHIINKIENAGGKASQLLSDPRKVVIEAAPRIGTIAPYSDPQFIFNDPVALNDLILKMNTLGGKVVWMRQHLGLAADLGSVIMPEDPNRGSEWINREEKFLFEIGPWTTLGVVRHELVHVEDLIIHPLPELELLDQLIESPKTLRDRYHNFSILNKVIGTLETRAYRYGNGLHVQEGHRSRYHYESLALMLYELKNRIRLNQGNFYLHPNAENFFSFCKSTALPVAGAAVLVLTPATVKCVANYLLPLIFSAP